MVGMSEKLKPIEDMHDSLNLLWVFWYKFCNVKKSQFYLHIISYSDLIKGRSTEAALGSEAARQLFVYITEM